MIFIGLQLNGPELSRSAIDRLLSAAAKGAISCRGDFEIGMIPAVNVVFNVPGSLGDFPQSTKPVAGRFSRKQKLLLVEVYVPKEQVEAGGSIDFVIDALHQANAIAAEVFEQKKAGTFDLVKANAIVDQVRDSLLAEKA